MRKIIITGATSFIGINLINKLIVDDCKIFAIIRPNSEKKSLIPVSEKVKTIEIPMCNYHQIDKHIGEFCDVFISLAWNGTRGADRDKEELQIENYNNSICSLKAAQRLGCKKFISAGSQAEYGSHETYISEDTIENPTTKYGKYKLDFYNYANDFCIKNKISFIEPRIFSLYGPGDYKKTMIIDILSKMAKNNECNLTLCEQMWDFLYIDDAIDAFSLFIEKDCESGIYNIGSGDIRKLKDYIIEMKKIANSESILNFGSVIQQKSDIINLMPDISKILKIGFRPKVSFSKGISNIIGCENNCEKSICCNPNI